MRYRTVICVLLLLGLLGCGRVTDRNEPTVVLRDPHPRTDPIAPPLPYYGEESIEERVAMADIIVKAGLADTTREIVTTTADGWNGKHFVALKFHLTVSEYLKGGGANEITALWVRGDTFDTQKEAEDAAPDIAATRDTTWDDREAIFFLRKEDLGKFFSVALQGDNDYYLSADSLGEDMYSLHNRRRKLWLPSARTTATGDSQEFLLAAPEPGVDTPTITLRELKSRIRSVNAELNAGDGSPEYADCVRQTYQFERIDRFFLETRGHSRYPESPDHGLGSGLAASTVVNEQAASGYSPDEKDRVWFDSGDAELFSVEFGDAVPWDSTGDGVKDAISYARRVLTTRPMPAGVYKFHFNYLPHYFVPCDGFMYRYEWTVTVNSPEGTLHELFFDPVTVGNAVEADATNGVLSPATFTDVNDWSVIINRISLESDTVMIKVYPDDAFEGHIMDFIALDGTVSLSLDVDDATVDGENYTLSWSVAEQPWHDGDKLMVRIREAR